MSVSLEHVVQMELAVVGAVIDQPDRYAEEVFSALPIEQMNQRVYHVASTVYTMWQDHDPINPHLVLEKMRILGLLKAGTGPLIADAVAFGFAVPSVAAYVAALSDLYLARRVHEVATRTQQMAVESDVHSALAYMANEASDLAGVAASRIVDDTLTLTEVLTTPLPEQEWIIPNLIGASDRVLITATEGAGKSTILRQIALSFTLGIDPFEPTSQIKPGKSLLIDCEVSRHQLLTSLTRMHSFAAKHNHSGSTDNMIVESRQGGLDLCNPADQAWLMRLVRQHRPTLISMGPLYRMTAGDINDEATVRCWQRVLEPLLEQGVSIVMEHHATNGMDSGGNRYLRPIGSSVIRRWFAQGLALRTPPCEAHERDFCRDCQRRGLIEFWRGSRDEAQWPAKVRAPRNDIWWLNDDYS